MRSFIIITGASKGIGKALLEDLDKPNNHILSISRNPPNYTPTSCVYAHLNVDLSQLDLSLLTNPIREFLNQSSGSDFLYLINNAGQLGEIAPVEELNLENFHQLMTLNFFAPLYLCQQFIQFRKHDIQFKRIINVSTGAAENAYASWSPYCASKAALKMLGACIGLEHPTLSIINFKPGVVETEMQQKIRSTNPKSFPSVNKFIDLYNSKKLLSVKFVSQKMMDLFNPNKQFSRELSIHDL